MSFGQRLKALREGVLTAAEAAEGCGRSVRSWENWEQGRYAPDPDLQALIIARLKRLVEASR